MGSAAGKSRPQQLALLTRSRGCALWTHANELVKHYNQYIECFYLGAVFCGGRESCGLLLDNAPIGLGPRVKFTMGGVPGEGVAPADGAPIRTEEGI